MIRALMKRNQSNSKNPRECSHQKRSHGAGVMSQSTADAEKTATTNATTEVTAPVGDHAACVKCQKCAQEQKIAVRYRWKLIVGLMPAFFLASLDLTIVATALPFIASHFDKFNQLNWIVTAFTLTSTAFIPAFGQLADVFGRHPTIQFAVLTMTVGSTLCAAAPNWPVLLLGRALQGISAAGIQNLVLIILADNVSLKEQAKNVSLFQLVNGIGYSVGPVIGGFITNANWRYCFVLGIPVALIGNGSIWFLLRKELKASSLELIGDTALQQLISGLCTLDLGGILLFILGAGLIILGTAWGGSTFAWNSAAVLVSLVVGAILLVLFITYEYLFEPGRIIARKLPRARPMLPFSLFRTRDVGLVAFISAATGTAIYSVFYFIGIYFTLVEAYPASKAGTQLLYYVPGIGVGVYAAIFLCNVRPRQTFWPLFVGTIVETTGIALLTYAVTTRKSKLVNVMMGIAGAGTGARFMPMNLHIAGICSDQIAAAYSILRFSMPFGGTLALTVMGSVFQNKMSAFFGSPAVQKANGNSTAFNLHTQAALQAVNSLPAPEQAAIRHAGARATMWAFVSILPVLVLALMASLMLGNVWIAPKAISESLDSEEESGATSGTKGSEVIDSIYLLALLRRRVNTGKRSKKVGGETRPTTSSSTAMDEKDLKLGG